MKVFLDIGAHVGETLEVVAREPRWGFDEIHAFEPAPQAFLRLSPYKTPGRHIHEFGLWDRDAVLPLHNAGAIGASVSEDQQSDSEGPTVDVELRDAGAWFKENLNPDDEIYAKINVEGAEAELIGRLVETGTLGYIDHLLIHLDVRKVPSKRHLEAQIRQQLDDAGVDYVDATEIMFRLGVARGTRNWLRWCTADPRWRDLRYKRLAEIESRLRNVIYPVKQKLHRTTA